MLHEDMGGTQTMKQPNIIFIMADDMGYGDFGLFSEGRVSTPHIDELANTGLCLTQHYSGSCVCTPARACFLTGRYNHRTGALEMRENRGLHHINVRERTIADYLSAAGYRTGLVGKWHNGTTDARHHPVARGFDEFAGFRHGLMNYYDWVIQRNGYFYKSDGRYLTDVFTDDAVGFIERTRTSPFFLYLAYNAPHTPLEAPEDEIKPYIEAGFSEKVATVYAMITRMDRGIGRIIETLDRTGLRDNTLVCFTSDNGPEMGGGQARFNCGYRGGKSNVWEGGIRVPMIVNWPGHSPENRGNDALFHYSDWLPTLCGRAGYSADYTRALDGNDVWKVLQGDTGGYDPVRFWQWNRYTPLVQSNAAMRDGQWKLVHPQIAGSHYTSAEEMAGDRILMKEPWRGDPTWLDLPLPAHGIPPDRVV